ncbi:MAG: antitoxin Xre-like helix-turn-helix domain-containing protein [Pseudomonadota bacterium]
MADVMDLRSKPPLTPVDVQTFTNADDRARLSGVALKAFRALAEHWELTNSEAAALLGVSESTWDRIKRGTWEQPLSQDQLTRASAAIGVYKGLHLLFADEMADRWPKLTNRGPVFQRKSPVEAMIEGGIPLMLETRRYIDAVRGGV